jgi:Holliday junction DNA helicase RuvA
MIARLTGILDALSPSECIVDVAGVGYRLYIPFTTYENLRNGEKCTLHVYTLHKEDQFKLYGFYSAGEREFFSILLNISGIGPSMALAILSGISIQRFAEAVESGRAELLMKIPGIGKSKAEKIIFEVKRKIKKLQAICSGSPEETSAGNDAIEALINLGFDDKKAAAVIDVTQKNFPGASLEKIIKEALKILA